MKVPRISAFSARRRAPSPAWQGLCWLASLLLSCGGVAAATNPEPSSPSFSPYDATRVSVVSELFQPGTAAPQAAVLLRRLYELRDFVDDRAALQRAISQAASDQRLHPLVRDEAQRYLALIDLHHGDLVSAEQRYQALGFIREWMLAGPFPASSLEASSPAVQCGQAWRPAPALGPHAWLNLNDPFPHASASVVCMAASVFSSARRVAAVRVSADAQFSVDVGGQEALARRQQPAFGFDRDAAAVQLMPGWNRILIRLYRKTEGPWRVAVRITRPEGGGMGLRSAPLETENPAGGRFSTSMPEERPIPQRGTPPARDGSRAAGWGTAESLVAMAQQAAATSAASAGSAAAWETLAWLEWDRDIASAAEHMQEAVRRNATAERWSSLAQMLASEDASQKFAALSSALRLDPAHPQATVALANYYIGRDQLEKARDLLLRALQRRPADLVARTRLADLYAMLGLHSRATQEYERLADDFPRPLWVKRALAQHEESIGDIAGALRQGRDLLSEAYDGSFERGLLARLLERQNDDAGLRRHYSEMAQTYPSESFPLVKLAALAAAAGDFSAAERALNSALALAPDDAEVRRQLSRVLAALGRPRSFGAVSRAQTRAGEGAARGADNPVQGHKTGPEASGEADPDAAYLVNAAELASGAKPSDDAASSGAVLLADVRVQRLSANNSNSVHVQQVYYIATDEGARAYSSLSVQYSPSADALQVLAARLYKPDGRVLEAENAGDNPVAERDVAMYYDVRARWLRFHNVEQGDVLELEYRISPLTDSNPYGDYFAELVAFRSGVGKRLKRYVLSVPASRSVHFFESGLPGPAIRQRNGERIYIWEAHDMTALRDEPRGPSAAEAGPYVHVSTFGSWDEVGRWYADLIRPQFALDADLRRALERLLAGKSTVAEKIHAIHKFVLRNTHYVALEFGIYSYKPYPVSQTYARRFGDCKDKASLMVALLREAGINAELALVRTQNLGSIEPRPASVAIFDHAIVYLPGQDLWLDGTAEYSGSRELPSPDQGALALTLTLDGRASLRQIPVTGPLDNYTRRVVKARVDADGVIRFSGATNVRGEDAPGLRRDYEAVERQREQLRDRLAEVFPTVRVEDVNVDSSLEREVTVKFRGTLETFAGQSVLSLPSSWMPRAYLETLAPLATRTQELVLPAAWSTEEELHFLMPSGAALRRLPKPTAMETPFGSASLAYRQVGHELIINTFVQFRQTRIAPDDYPAFRQFCSGVERAFRNDVRVELKP